MAKWRLVYLFFILSTTRVLSREYFYSDSVIDEHFIYFTVHKKIPESLLNSFELTNASPKDLFFAKLLSSCSNSQNSESLYEATEDFIQAKNLQFENKVLRQYDGYLYLVEGILNSKIQNYQIAVQKFVMAERYFKFKTNNLMLLVIFYHKTFPLFYIDKILDYFQQWDALAINTLNENKSTDTYEALYHAIMSNHGGLLSSMAIKDSSYLETAFTFLKAHYAQIPNSKIAMLMFRVTWDFST